MTDLAGFLIACSVPIWAALAFTFIKDFRMTEADLYAALVPLLLAFIFAGTQTGLAVVCVLFGPMASRDAADLVLFFGFTIYFAKVLHFRFRNWGDRPRPRGCFDL